MIADAAIGATLAGLAGCAVFVLLSGLFSGAETGIYCTNSARLRLLAHQGDVNARRMLELLSDRSGLLFTTLFGTNLANYAAPLCLTFVLLHAVEATSRGSGEQLAELYTTMILTPIVFVFGEIVPKNVFQRNADRLMPRLAGILRATHLLFQWTGIVAVQRWISNLALRKLNRQTTSGSALHTSLDVYQVLREGAAEGVLSRMQSTIIERVHLLKTVRVGSIMVPSASVEMLPAEATRGSIEQRLRRLRHSRIPIYRGDRRNVVGVVHMLDVLGAPAASDMASLARPPIPIPARLPVMDALALLQREYRRIAIVVDPNGRCLGVVTVKDLVEEIVGELAAW